MATRMESGIERGPRVTIEVDGRAVPCHAGETVATALLLAEATAFNVVCNMGVCFECMVGVATAEGSFVRRRACMTPVEDGLRVKTGERL